MLSNDFFGGAQSATDPGDEFVDSAWQIVGGALGAVAKQLATGGRRAVVGGKPVMSRAQAEQCFVWKPSMRN